MSNIQIIKVVPADSFKYNTNNNSTESLIKEGWVPASELPFGQDYANKIDALGIKMERPKAETNPKFKQPIGYVCIYKDNMIWATQRLKGDKRLTNKWSIGMGGHVDWGETIDESVFRELQEELDFSPFNLIDIKFMGSYLNLDTEVNSVHLGLFYMVESEDFEIAIKETNKLKGQWLDFKEIEALADSGMLEDWSIEMLKRFKEAKSL